MIIRAPGPADLDAVEKLARRIPEAPRWPPAAYEQFVRGAHAERRMFLAEVKETLAGFAAGRLLAGACELESIAVDPAFRRRGAGGSLLQAFLDWAKAAQSSQVQLEVREGNISALALYIRYGFRRVGLRRNYYRSPDENAVLMSLALCPED